MKRAWIVSFVCAMATVGGFVLLASKCAGSGGKTATIPEASPRSRPRRPAGVLATGGVPVREEEALELLFSRHLPDWIATLNDNEHPVAERHMSRDAVLSANVKALLGPDAAAALTDVLDRATDAMTATPDGSDAAADALTGSVIAFNGELAAAALPYLIDSEVAEYDDGPRLVIVFSFAVERVTLYKSSQHTIRALQVSRVDELNWSLQLLGFTSPMRREAMVLLPQVEDRLVDRLLPMLSPAAVDFYRLDDETRAQPWYAGVAARVREVIRREYGGDAAAIELGTLIARRKTLFAMWNAELADRGVSLEMPTTLELDWDFRKPLEGIVALAQVDELAAIEEKLASPEMTRAFVAARSLLVSSIERHEIHHQVDNLRKKPLPYPRVLLDFLGPLRNDKGMERRLPRQTHTELSAYIAEIARDTATPGVAMTIITQFVMEATYWDSPEGYVGLIVLEQLASALGVDTSHEIAKNGRVDRSRAAAIYLAITARPPDDVRKAAANLWAKLFGMPLPLIEKQR